MPTEANSAMILEDKVEEILRKANFNFEKQIVVGESRPDFLVTTDNGDQIVLEVEDWERGPETISRGMNQAKRYKELSNTSAALLVTTGVIETITSAALAVTPIGNLVNTIMSLAATAAQSKKPTKAQQIRPAPKEKVFVSMPFDVKYDDTFLVAIEPASLKNGAIAERVDHNGTAGPVVTQIQAMIKAAKVIVADLSGSLPNVLHEIGYAEALRKPIVQICSTPRADIPFNVRNNQTERYVIGQTMKLRKTLEIELAKYI